MDQTGRADRINRSGARTFGRGDVVFEPRTGGSFPLNGSSEDWPIFRLSYASVDPETGATVQSRTPMLTVQARVLPGGAPPDERDVFTVAGVRYVVTRIEPRDNGTVRCFLRRA